MNLLNKAKDILDSKEMRNISEIMDEKFKELNSSISGIDNTLNTIKSKRISDNIMAFIGGSGGTGTSTIAVNTAKQLANDGYTVLLIDLNILYPSIHNFFNINGGLTDVNVEKLKRPDLVDYLTGGSDVNEVLKAAKAIKHIENLSIMYSYNRATLDLLQADNEHTEEGWKDSLEKFSDLYDIVIIDVPNQPILSLVGETLFKADRIYIVWDENVNCVSVSERLRSIMQSDKGVSIWNKSRMILNKRTNVHYTEEPFKSLGLNMCISAIPFEQSVIESGLRGEIYIMKGSSMSSKAHLFASRIKELADYLIEDGGGNSK